jgi:hypothetical protein
MHQRCFNCKRLGRSIPVSACHAPAACFTIQLLPARVRQLIHSSVKQQHAQHVHVVNSDRHGQMCRVTNNQDTAVGCQPELAIHMGVAECITIGTTLSLCLADASLAMEQGSSGLTYNPTGGEEFFKNLAGVAYIILVAVFLFRVFTRRAKRAREQVCRYDCKCS